MVMGRPLPPPKKKGLSKRLVALAFASAVFAGIGGTFLVVTLMEPEPVPVPVNPPAPVVVKPPPEPEVKPVAVKVTPVDSGELDVEVEVEDKVETPEKVEKVEKVTTPKTPKQKPVVVAKAAPPPEKPESPPPPKEKPAPAQDEAIPAGDGKLLISVAGGDGQVFVNGTQWDAPPVQKKISSGHHRVIIKLTGGSQANTKVAVWPDKTTRLTLDAASGRWSQN